MHAHETEHHCQLALLSLSRETIYNIVILLIIVHVYVLNYIITGWESYSGLMVKPEKLSSQISMVLNHSHFSWISILAFVVLY